MVRRCRRGWAVRAARVTAAGALAALALAALALAGGGASSRAGAQVTSATQWQSWYTSSANNVLTGIRAFSKSDIWAVGQPDDSSDHPFVIQWNGAGWHSLAIPGSAGFSTVNVAGSSAKDVWVFGSNTAGKWEAFRWGGARWHTQSSAPVSGMATPVVLSATSVWVDAGPTWQGSVPTSYLYHWNGSTWQKTSIRGEFISGIAASSSGAVLAVGNVPNLTTGVGPVSVFRWSSGRWQALAMQHPRSQYAPQIAVGPLSDIWVDNVATVAGDDSVLHWDCSKWTTLVSYGGATGTPALAADGDGGVWVSDFRHYTGAAWVSATHAPSIYGTTSYQAPVTPVPGSPGTYAEAAGLSVYGKPAHPIVLVYGPLP